MSSSYVPPTPPMAPSAQRDGLTVTLHDLVTQAHIQPACNQIEVHAYYVRESLVNYCLSRNICVVAHTPLGGGLFNQETWDYETPMQSEVIQGIAEAHEVTAAQVLLRYLLQRGIVVIPKSNCAEHRPIWVLSH